MNLTSQQAAKKLGVTAGTVRAWGAEGKIERVQVGQGKEKKHFLYDSKSVNALVKTIKGSSVGRKKILAVRRATPKPLQSLSSRLDRIEGKLDELLTMWR